MPYTKQQWRRDRRVAAGFHAGGLAVGGAGAGLATAGGIGYKFGGPGKWGSQPLAWRKAGRIGLGLTAVGVPSVLLAMALRKRANRKLAANLGSYQKG